jgi:hypothetical protein
MDYVGISSKRDAADAVEDAIVRLRRGGWVLQSQQGYRALLMRKKATSLLVALLGTTLLSVLGFFFVLAGDSLSGKQETLRIEMTKSGMRVRTEKKELIAKQTHDLRQVFSKRAIPNAVLFLISLASCFCWYAVNMTLGS